MLVELSDQDLLNRLINFEDHFVERKTIADQKDWVKTVVAFANSAPNGYPCVLYIGVKDNGEMETPQQDLDSAQKTLNKKLKAVYPPPPYLPKIISKDGRQALAVIVPGSALRPHFSGPAYVRSGSETINASEDQLTELIARRNSVASKILEYKDRNVTVIEWMELPGTLPGLIVRSDITVIECNQFWVTLVHQGNKDTYYVPLNRVTLNFDGKKNQLKLELKGTLVQ